MDCSSRVGFSFDERSKQRTIQELATCTMTMQLLKGDERRQEEGDSKDDSSRVKRVPTEIL